jgi:hypothetical protein
MHAHMTEIRLPLRQASDDRLHGSGRNSVSFLFIAIVNGTYQQSWLAGLDARGWYTTEIVTEAGLHIGLGRRLERPSGRA